MKKRTSETAQGSASNSILRVVRRVGVAPSVAVLLLVIGFASPFSGQAPAVATVGLTPGWATFGEAVPQGAATTGLQIGNLPTQTDIKNRWPDGSIRFAIVTAHVPAAGDYAVTAAAPAAGDFAPTMPSAATTLILDGVTYTATLPSAPAQDGWLSGPLVAEGRSVVTPITAGGTAHDFLRVNYDTRVYRDGQARVDVSVENLLDQAGATTVTYDVAITVNHQLLFAKRAVRHVYLTRWRQVFAIGSAPLAAVTPDLGPFTASRALPAYLSLVPHVVSTPTGARYEILREGALTANMADARLRAEWAPFPDWTARYLVHKHATQRAFVLAHGDLSGSWPVHVREAEDSATRGVGSERLLSLDQRPTLWYDARAASGGLDHVKGTPLPLVEPESITPGAGQTALIPDNAHQPSLAYVPYLLTGDRYYAEEMAFWANYGMLRTGATDGIRGAGGILAANGAGGYAWALRNLADAAAYYPDASPVRAYLAGKVTANLQWLDAYAHAVRSTAPAPALWPVQQADGTPQTNPREQDALAYAIDRASKQGFAGGLTHRDAIAKARVQSVSNEGVLPGLAPAPGLIAAMGVGSGPSTRGASSPETRLVLMIGIENGWPGAQAAYDVWSPSIGAASASGPHADLAQRAGWALDFTSPGSGSTVTLGADESSASDGLAAAAVSITAAASLPVSIVFRASTDHAIVVSYLLEVFANGSNPNTASPIASSSLGKPGVDANGDITVDRSTLFNALAPGTYLVTVCSIGPGGPGRSTAVTYTRAAVPTATFSVSPTSISSGQSATLSWSTTNATTVTIDQGIGTLAATGTRSVAPTATTTYTLTAANAADSVTATASVTVTAADTIPPVLSGVASSGLTTTSATIGFTTNEQTFHRVEYGTTTAYGTMTAPDTMLMTSHNETLTGLVSGTLYHYRGRATDAAGNGGMSGDFTFTTQSAPLPTATLTASPASIMSGAASTLNWSTTGATTVSLNQSIGTVAATGTRSVSPTSTTMYTLTATNGAGSVTRTATVTVTTAPPAPTATMTAAPSSITSGAASTLTWNSTGATTLTINQGIGTVAASGTRSVSPTATTTYTLTATNTAGSVTATATVTVSAPGTGWAISINFGGTAPVPMGATESAGVVAKANWNNTTGATRSTPLALMDETGAATGATVAWSSNGVRNTPITDGVGHRRMMKGFLNTGSATTTTVTVAGLPAGAYDVYLYADGDNGATIRTGVYRISGAGITTTTINLTDAANTNFNGTLFTQGNNSSGNFVKFSINAGGFSLTATPSAASSRAPVNGIQIVPTGKTTPPITWATPANIVSGTALGATQLNATTTVPGTFVYTPASGTVLGAGAGQTLSVTFTPTDTASYNVASATVLITVQAAQVAVPNVVGQTQAAATTAIDNAGLVVGTVTNASSATASGLVTSSSPVAGTQVAAGSAVNLVVSTGPTQPPSSTVSIWSASAAPSTFETTDNGAVELGLKFRSDVAGTVTGVRFYKGTTTTGTHTGTLWSVSGTKLASATFTGETASGWQAVTFSSPVAISANTVYVVSYHTNVGQYAYTYDTFATAGVDNGPLHALRAGVSGGNGVFRYGGIAFPTASWGSTNYWVDVLFVAGTALVP